MRLLGRKLVSAFVAWVVFFLYISVLSAIYTPSTAFWLVADFHDLAVMMIPAGLIIFTFGLGVSLVTEWITYRLTDRIRLLVAVILQLTAGFCFGFVFGSLLSPLMFQLYGVLCAATFVLTDEYIRYRRRKV